MTPPAPRAGDTFCKWCGQRCIDEQARTALAEIAGAATKHCALLRAEDFDEYAAERACTELEILLTTHAAAIRGAK